jgi:hypothetical protein
MTGSGKTGLCISLLEEAALDGIPALVIDPKGDIANLLLTFPGLTAAEFQPWIDPAEAARKGATPEGLAAKTAETWRNGLAEWGEDGDRIRRFRESADIAVYTPGSKAGLPLSILRSFTPPPEGSDAGATRERITASVSGLLGLVGIAADPLKSREHILLCAIVDAAWSQGHALDLAGLIGAIQKPPFAKVGVFDVETFYPAKDRLDLAMAVNNLLASPGFGTWLEGEALDAQRLLFTAEGKPRISIVSIAHLTDAERMFVVTLVANELVGGRLRIGGRCHRGRVPEARDRGGRLPDLEGDRCRVAGRGGGQPFHGGRRGAVRPAAGRSGHRSRSGGPAGDAARGPGRRGRDAGARRDGRGGPRYGQRAPADADRPAGQGDRR